MRLTLTHRTAARLEDELPDALVQKTPTAWFAGCRTTQLPVYLVGGEADSVALYEQLFIPKPWVAVRTGSDLPV